MNKAVCEIIHLIRVNILSEFMMINGNTMNTTVHNNDFQHLIKKHYQYFIYPNKQYNIEEIQ